MSTPTVVVATAPPLTANHVAMAARLQAKAEAQQAANMVAALPAKVRSTPTKIVEFLRLPQIGNSIKGGAGRAGGWLSKAAAPAAGFIKTVGIIPASLLFATGDRGQAVIRWVAKSVWGLFSWTVRKAARLLDRTIRIFGRPGNWLADKLLAGTTKGLTMAAVPVGMTYNLTAPLVSSKAGHIKFINRGARFLVVHRVVRMFVRNPWLAIPLEIVVDAMLIGRVEQALNKGKGKVLEFRQGFEDGKAEAAAKAAVDAHIAANAAANAKTRLHTTVEAGKDTSIPEAMGKIGEVIEEAGKKADEFLTTQTSPTAAASPGTAANGTERSDSDEGEASTEGVADQPGQPVETPEELAVRLQAEGKIGQVTVPADATREEMLDAAQRAADKLGEDVVAVLPTGESAVVEPTGSVVERVIEAEGPEMDGEAPMSRGTERALRHAGAGGQRKPSGKRRG